MVPDWQRERMLKVAIAATAAAVKAATPSPSQRSSCCVADTEPKQEGFVWQQSSTTNPEALLANLDSSSYCQQGADAVIIIIIINPCKPYLTASAPRLTHWGGGK
jgi:hypothetical protein